MTNALLVFSALCFVAAGIWIIGYIISGLAEAII